MDKTVIAALAATAVGLTAMPALAVQDQAKGAAQPMTRAEVEAKTQEHFTKVDANHDGFVTLEEVRARMQMMGKEHRDKIFTSLDTNGDGSISRAEFDAGSARESHIKKGIITVRKGGEKKEGASAAMSETRMMCLTGPNNRKMVLKIRRQGVIPGEEEAMMPGRGFRMGLPEGAGMDAMIVEMFSRTDANKDGRISLDEATKAHLAMFEHADANKDGKLSNEERCAVMRPF